MFGKYFASTFTGSMMGSGPCVFAVWSYAIANAVDSTVELNPKLMAALIGTTEENIVSAIDFLSKPDPKSRSKEEEGKRIIREGEFSYHVVNHSKYRQISSEEHRREWDRNRKRAQRAKPPVSAPVRTCPQQSTISTYTEAEAEAEAECGGTSNTISGDGPVKQSNKPTPQSLETKKEEGKQETNKFRNAPTLAEATNYFDRASSNYSRQEVKRCWQSFEATAVDGVWMWGRRQVTDWRHAMECRINDARDKNPNQNTAKNTTEAAIKAIKAIRP